MRIPPGHRPNPLLRRVPFTVPGLEEEGDFGPNPGNLRLFHHLPHGLAEGAPLVVVLHGCTQTAAGYDLGAGWAQLAQRFGFAVLAPEQKALNNPNTCFDWFLPEDITRGQGEAASIRQMILYMTERFALDPARVFVTGLSAGGAMTAAMLATYPEVFAGGAIIAGLPYGAAENVREALDAMRQPPQKSAREWGDTVRTASPHSGSWPVVSIWHGDADYTVSPANADALVAQWTDLHGVNAPQDVPAHGHRHRRWHDAGGRVVVEEHRIAGLGHGTPITIFGPEACGVPAPFILESGISSSYRIADFWGLTVGAEDALPSVANDTVQAATVSLQMQAAFAPPPMDGIKATILKALKRAGLA